MLVTASGVLNPLDKEGENEKVATLDQPLVLSVGGFSVASWHAMLMRFQSLSSCVSWVQDLLIGIAGSLIAVAILALFARIRRQVAGDHERMKKEAVQVAGNAQLLAGAAAYQEGKAQLEHGRLIDALEAFGRALKFVRKPRDELAVRARIGMALFSMGEFPRAYAEFQRCQKLAEATGNLKAKAGSMRYMALIRCHTGRSSEAIEIYHKAIILYNKVGTFHQRLDFEADLFAAFLDQGEIKRAVRLNAKSMRFHFLTGSMDVVAGCVVNLAVIYIHARKYKWALSMLQFWNWFPLWPRLPHIVNSLKLNTALCNVHLGMNMEAMSNLTEAVKLAKDNRYRDLEAVATLALADLNLSMADWEGAFMLAELAEKGFDAIGHKEGVAKSLGVAGEVRWRQGDAEGAVAIHKKALAIAEAAESVDSMRNLLHALQADLAACSRSSEFPPLVQSVLSRHPALERFREDLVRGNKIANPAIQQGSRT